jgi:hypothetical protein
MHRRQTTYFHVSAISFLLCYCTVSYAEDAVLKTGTQQDKWKQSTTMPSVIVAKVGTDGDSIDILEPVNELREEVVQYTVQVPVVQDGKTSYTTETRTRTVGKFELKKDGGSVKTVRRNIKFDRLSAFTVNGTKLSPSELANRLRMPLHVLFGHKPDEFAKAVLKDDLIVIIDNSFNVSPPTPPQLPAPAPTPARSGSKP